MRLPSRPCRSTVAALAALATVAAYGLAGISGLLHLALTPHRVCPDHGELVDAGHAGRAAAAAPAPTDRPALAAAFAPEDHGHDHCAVADHLRQQGLARVPATIGPPAPPAERAPAGPAAGTHRPIPTLLLAPKHSPPATA